MKRIACLAGLIGFFQSAFGQNLYFPPLVGNTWDQTSASTLGYSNERIDSLYAYLEANNSKGFLLLQDGKIVLEKYFGTFTQDSTWYWASAGKTLTAFAAGIASQKGLLDLQAPSHTYLGTGWSSMSVQQEDSVRVWHHITMTTGLDYGVPNPDCTDPSCLQYKSPAGKQWYYHNAPYTLMDGIIENATGQTLNGFVSQQISYKTGISGLFIPVGDNNVFFSKMRSMGRFGLLLLAKGWWNGNPVLTDTQFLYNMSHSSQNLNPSYGYLTWLNGQSAYMLPGSSLRIPGTLLPSAPSDAYAAMGKNGQIICVIPSQNRVWVRIGDRWNGSGIDQVPNVFCDRIWTYLNALENSAGLNSQAPTGALYPQPAAAGDWLYGPFAQGEQLSFFDAQGRLVSRAVAAEGRVCMPELSGWYILINEKGQKTRIWVY